MTANTFIKKPAFAKTPSRDNVLSYEDGVIAKIKVAPTWCDKIELALNLNGYLTWWQIYIMEFHDKDPSLKSSYFQEAAYRLKKSSPNCLEEVAYVRDIISNLYSYLVLANGNEPAFAFADIKELIHRHHHDFTDKQIAFDLTQKDLTFDERSLFLFLLSKRPILRARIRQALNLLKNIFPTHEMWDDQWIKNIFDRVKQEK